MRFDGRTPTEHVQRGRAAIMSLLMSSTHLIFFLSCHQSRPAEEHFLPDATLLCQHRGAFRFVWIFFFLVSECGLHVCMCCMLAPFQPDYQQKDTFLNKLSKKKYDWITVFHLMQLIDIFVIIYYILSCERHLFN